VVLEPTFLLMYYGGFSYTEIQNLPVAYKKWFIERISKEIEKSNENSNGQSRATHHNTAETRALQGRSRHHVPSKLRRFT
jgi:hypothetical protein